MISQIPSKILESNFGNQKISVWTLDRVGYVYSTAIETESNLSPNIIRNDRIDLKLYNFSYENFLSGLFLEILF